MGDLGELPNDCEAFKECYREVYPEAKKGNTPVAAGMLIRFANEVAIGDYVVYPSKSDRKINIGAIEGEYYYAPERDEYRHQRKVNWLKRLPRTAFSQGALYETGSAQSFFRLKTYGASLCTRWMMTSTSTPFLSRTLRTRVLGRRRNRFSRRRAILCSRS